MKVLMHLHPCLILYRYHYCLVQTFSVTAHTLVSSLEMRLSLDKMHVFFSNSYLAERSSVACLARFSDGVEES